MSRSKTLFDKVWDSHVVWQRDGEPALLYIDLHLVHEVTSPQAFEGLRLAKREVRRPDLTFATIDHNVPTTAVERFHIKDQIAAQQVATLQDDAGSNRKLLAAPAQRAQIEAACPVLLRRLLQGHARELGADQENVSGDQGNVEQLSVLDFLGAGADQFHDDLARRRYRDDVAWREHGARLRLEDAFATADPMDEQAVPGQASFGGRDCRSGEGRVLVQPVGT